VHSGYVDEDGAGGEKRRAEVDRGRRDPEVVGGDGLVQRVTGLSAHMAKRA
jgi:hypothetical protein